MFLSIDTARITNIRPLQDDALIRDSGSKPRPSWLSHGDGGGLGTWTFRTLDCSYHGLFVPSLDDSYRDARLTKINVSYQNVHVFSMSQTSP